MCVDACVYRELDFEGGNVNKRNRKKRRAASRVVLFACSFLCGRRARARMPDGLRLPVLFCMVHTTQERFLPSWFLALTGSQHPKQWRAAVLWRPPPSSHSIFLHLLAHQPWILLGSYVACGRSAPSRARNRGASVRRRLADCRGSLLLSFFEGRQVLGRGVLLIGVSRTIADVGGTTRADRLASAKPESLPPIYHATQKGGGRQDRTGRKTDAVPIPSPSSPPSIHPST